jgi:hypothetical protein
MKHKQARKASGVDEPNSELTTLARETLHKRITSELKGSGRNSMSGIFRLSSKDFGDFDWSAFTFKKLKNDFLSLCPETFQLVSFLCGADHEISSEDDAEPDDDDQMGAEIAEEDVRNAGFDAEPINDRHERKLEGRTIVAVGVMGIILYARSRRANILQVVLGFAMYASRVPKRALAILNRRVTQCSAQ